jgi:hypothetical protein
MRFVFAVVLSIVILGGSLIELMAMAGGYRNQDEMIREASSHVGIPMKVMDGMLEFLKGKDLT